MGRTCRHGQNPGQSGDLHRHRALKDRTVAELTVAVEPPRPKGAGGFYRKRMRATGCKTTDLSKAIEQYRHITLSGCSISELPIAVIAPCIKSSGGRDSQRVELTCGDVRHGKGRCNLNRNRALGVGDAVAELALSIVTERGNAAIGTYN